MPDLGNGWVPVVLTSRPGVLTYATVPLMCPAAFRTSFRRRSER
jgi:hypothetical protein